MQSNFQLAAAAVHLAGAETKDGFSEVSKAADCGGKVREKISEVVVEKDEGRDEDEEGGEAAIRWPHNGRIL